MQMSYAIPQFKLSTAATVFCNEKGEVTGYGGYYAYEQLVWLSLRLILR